MYSLTRSVWRCRRHPCTSQRPQPRALTCGVRHDFISLEQKPEIHDSADEHEQQREHERELDELGASLGIDTRASYRNHRAATAPAEIGSAYGNRGLEAVRKVRPGMGCRPAMRQKIKHPHRFLTICIK